MTSFIVSNTAATLGIVCNSLLIYLVLKKTPKQLSNYSVLILNNSICDFFASVAALFVRQRYLSYVAGSTLLT
ncbi:unnamed protein product [Haemonchus placei]|uniref:G_PROTEIN_RECEP_F1_2 domain-containing protein n=1 Tax=Haemonchus placei TaxID=6290 RepID=A0A3P7ZZ27_HAEPC|nr:unnamed protein product [Haemonchus placei]